MDVIPLDAGQEVLPSGLNATANTHRDAGGDLTGCPFASTPRSVLAGGRGHLAAGMKCYPRMVPGASGRRGRSCGRIQNWAVEASPHAVRIVLPSGLNTTAVTGFGWDRIAEDFPEAASRTESFLPWHQDGPAVGAEDQGRFGLEGVADHPSRDGIPERLPVRSHVSTVRPSGLSRAWIGSWRSSRGGPSGRRWPCQPDGSIFASREERLSIRAEGDVPDVALMEKGLAEGWPVATSHNRADLSAPPARTVRPSGLKAALYTWPDRDSQAIAFLGGCFPQPDLPRCRTRWRHRAPPSGLMAMA
jgi:hypothetical protein